MNNLKLPIFLVSLLLVSATAMAQNRFYIEYESYSNSFNNTENSAIREATEKSNFPLPTWCFESVFWGDAGIGFSFGYTKKKADIIRKLEDDDNTNYTLNKYHHEYRRIFTEFSYFLQKQQNNFLYTASVNLPLWFYQNRNNSNESFEYTPTDSLHSLESISAPNNFEFGVSLGGSVSRLFWNNFLVGIDLQGGLKFGSTKGKNTTELYYFEDDEKKLFDSEIKDVKGKTTSTFFSPIIRIGFQFN